MRILALYLTCFCIPLVGMDKKQKIKHRHPLVVSIQQEADAYKKYDVKIKKYRKLNVEEKELYMLWLFLHLNSIEPTPISHQALQANQKIHDKKTEKKDLHHAIARITSAALFTKDKRINQQDKTIAHTITQHFFKLPFYLKKETKYTQLSRGRTSQKKLSIPKEPFGDYTLVGYPNGTIDLKNKDTTLYSWRAHSGPIIDINTSKYNTNIFYSVGPSAENALIQKRAKQKVKKHQHNSAPIVLRAAYAKKNTPPPLKVHMAKNLANKPYAALINEQKRLSNATDDTLEATPKAQTARVKPTNTIQYQSKIIVTTQPDVLLKRRGLHQRSATLDAAKQYSPPPQMVMKTWHLIHTADFCAYLIAYNLAPHNLKKSMLQRLNPTGDIKQKILTACKSHIETLPKDVQKSIEKITLT